jgi:hypothetical protein
LKRKGKEVAARPKRERTAGPRASGWAARKEARVVEGSAARTAGPEGWVPILLVSGRRVLGRGKGGS